MTDPATDTDDQATSKTERLYQAIVGLLLIAGFLVILLWNSVVIRIMPGHVGVLYSLLFGGTVIGDVYHEGIALKLPWNKMYIFDVRIQAKQFNIHALSAEGMAVTVDMTLLFRLNKSNTDKLLKRIGPEYNERVIDPLAISSVREVIARYDSHELYTVDADSLKADLLRLMRDPRFAYVVSFEDVLLTRIQLPAAVTAAIEEKLAQEQMAAAYEFRLTRERAEAERKRIEAIGLRNFYSLVGSSLTERLLTWRGIEATVELAKSPNSKIVIVGSGKDQLPLILGSDIHNLPKQDAAVPPVSPVAGDAKPLPNWDKLPPIFKKDVYPGHKKPSGATPDAEKTPPTEPKEGTGP